MLQPAVKPHFVPTEHFHIVVHQSNVLPAQYNGMGSLYMLHLYSVYVMPTIHMDWASMLNTCHCVPCNNWQYWMI